MTSGRSYAGSGGAPGGPERVLRMYGRMYHIIATRLGWAERLVSGVCGSWECRCLVLRFRCKPGSVGLEQRPYSHLPIADVCGRGEIPVRARGRGTERELLRVLHLLLFRPSLGKVRQSSPPCRSTNLVLNVVVVGVVMGVVLMVKGANVGMSVRICVCVCAVRWSLRVSNVGSSCLGPGRGRRGRNEGAPGETGSMAFRWMVGVESDV